MQLTLVIRKEFEDLARRFFETYLEAFFKNGGSDFSPLQHESNHGLAPVFAFLKVSGCERCAIYEMHF